MVECPCPRLDLFVIGHRARCKASDAREWGAGNKYLGKTKEPSREFHRTRHINLVSSCAIIQNARTVGISRVVVVVRHVDLPGLAGPRRSRGIAVLVPAGLGKLLKKPKIYVESAGTRIVGQGDGAQSGTAAGGVEAAENPGNGRQTSEV